MRNINKLNHFLNFKIAGLTGRTFLPLGLLALVSSCMQSAHIPSQEYRILKPDFQDTFDIPPPSDNSTGRKIKQWSTSYITRQPTPYKNGVPFRDINGVPISDNVSRFEWCMGSQEGSVKTTFKGEEIRITHVGKFNKEPSYFFDCRAVFKKDKKLFYSYGLTYHAKTTAPFGLGIYDYFLVPYRTIAVELGNEALHLRRGDVVYIKDVTKNTITDPYSGKQYKHDGYFFVGDVEGDHIDTFCGFKYNCLSPFTGGDKDNHILSTALVISDPAIIEKLTRMHLKSSYR